MYLNFVIDCMKDPTSVCRLKTVKVLQFFLPKFNQLDLLAERKKKILVELVMDQQFSVSVNAIHLLTQIIKFNEEDLRETYQNFFNSII